MCGGCIWAGAVLLLHQAYGKVILGEEVATSKMTLFDVTKQICDAIQARGEQGMMKPPSFVTLLSCKTVHAEHFKHWHGIS
jgi:hypothetical protein